VSDTEWTEWRVPLYSAELHLHCTTLHATACTRRLHSLFLSYPIYDFRSNTGRDTILFFVGTCIGASYRQLSSYTQSEAWSGVNWADLMAAQGVFGTDFYDRSTRTIVGTMLGTEYRPVIKIGPKGALGSHEIRPIHSAPSLGQSIPTIHTTYLLKGYGQWRI